MIKENQYILIMAGGVGSRFWPMSRESRPKQFIDILGTGKSLIRLTFERCLNLVPADRIFILTHKKYKKLVLDHLPELAEDQVFLEPSRNNTAPCIAYASIKVKKRFGDGVCLVAPSDHIIMKETAFVDVVRRGFEYCEHNNALVTLGIQPTRPDTGYGYIHYNKTPRVEGIHDVIQFTEKPDKDTAATFVEAGDYLWNSGMFIWGLDTVLGEFQKYATKTYDILNSGWDYYYGSGEEHFLAENYPLTEGISVDYALMEKSENVAVIPADLGWSDLGTWGSLYQHLLGGEHKSERADRQGNVKLGLANEIRHSENCLVVNNSKHLVVCNRLNNIAVISEDDVVLIFNKDYEQEVKEIRSQLHEDGLDVFL